MCSHKKDEHYKTANPLEAVVTPEGSVVYPCRHRDRDQVNDDDDNDKQPRYIAGVLVTRVVRNKDEGLCKCNAFRPYSRKNFLLK
jgi:hypothetical protein